MTKTGGKKRETFLLAPDSLKGSLSAVQACQSLARGIHAAMPDAEILFAPLADGGEGTVEALALATGAELQTTRARGPLGGEVNAVWARTADNHAILELAAASGLPLVPEGQRNALTASTYGTGQLIRAALDAGCTDITLGIGGSATTDGGTGILSALGMKFLDADGAELLPGGAALQQLERVDTAELHPALREGEATLRILCDVTNPLCGESGAAHVYGPQKGASPEQVRQLDKALGRFAEVTNLQLGRDVAGLAGAGAAGGTGYGLVAWLGARLVPGITAVLEAARFDELCTRADWVFTAEGALDSQTLQGKTIAGVAAAARKHGVPVIAFGGAVRLNGAELDQLGLASAFALPDAPLALQDCIARADELLATAAERAARLLAVGQRDR